MPGTDEGRSPLDGLAGAGPSSRGNLRIVLGVAARITFQSTLPGGAPSAVAARFAAIRAEMKVPAAFPDDVNAEAEAAAKRDVTSTRDDLTGLPFLTLDPPGSMDLDQAMFLERDGAGYRVRYAIADVPAFVQPGGAVDAEARRRGVTIYCPDVRAPLHPPVLSEGAASLLPGVVRPAFVWDVHLDAAGNQRDATVTRAAVRSVSRRDYAGVEGAADEQMVLLREIGERRLALEEARGGASLPMPEQEVIEVAPGISELVYRPPLASEEWNAQISLLAGMAAAQLMIRAGVGILRTMPPPDAGAVERLRRQAGALGVAWPESMPYGRMLRTLDRDNPVHLALIHEAATLFRGAGYTALDGEAPNGLMHAAVAAPYAHVTAPLRRLVDRFGLVTCEAITSGQAVPEWVRAALPALPDIMAGADRQAGAVERACIDAAEASTLAGHVGETFDAVVVDQNGKRSIVVQLVSPAIVATVPGSAPLGAAVTVTVVAADVAAGTVTLATADDPSARWHGPANPRSPR